MTKKAVMLVEMEFEDSAPTSSLRNEVSARLAVIPGLRTVVCSSGLRADGSFITKDLPYGIDHDEGERHEHRGY